MFLRIFATLANPVGLKPSLDLHVMLWCKKFLPREALSATDVSPRAQIVSVDVQVLSALSLYKPQLRHHIFSWTVKF
jgi:hypothetical protein